MGRVKVHNLNYSRLCILIYLSYNNVPIVNETSHMGGLVLFS